MNNIFCRQAQRDSEGAAVLHVPGGARSDRQAEEPLRSRDQWQRAHSPRKFLSNIISIFLLLYLLFILYSFILYENILFSMDILKFYLLFKYLLYEQYIFV